MNGTGLNIDRFYLPYQFVPVTGICNGRPVGVQSAAIEHIAAGTLDDGVPGAGARHDLWIQGHRSGRICCRLTTETPTFIGAKRGEDEPTPVEPATGPDGQPIIPGNSLRGVIGSIAETLSQSAMRVLGDGCYQRPGRKRGQKENVPGSIHEAFRRCGKGDGVLPLGSDRMFLTPAELLFGVVRETNNVAPNTKDEKLPALAGRLRFHDARLVEDNGAAEALTLQILSSPKQPPKLPSPAFYFQDSGGQRGVRKAQLDLNKHKPNGRKYYLHHPKAQIVGKRYQSRHDAPKLRNQKVKIAPLKPGNVFEFDIHYDNLSSAELHLLLTSLRPAEDFRHRIGMGKPLGLGTVRIDVVEVSEVDRVKRYGEDALDAARAHQTWHCDREFKQGTCAEAVANSTALVDRASHAILCQIGAWKDGKPGALEANVPVCYPRTREQLSAFVGREGTAEQAEAELFKWNVANDREGGPGYQALQPVPTKGTMKPFSAEPPGRPGDRRPSNPRR